MKKLEYSESTQKKITVDFMEVILIGKINLSLAPAALSSQDLFNKNKFRLMAESVKSRAGNIFLLH